MEILIHPSAAIVGLNNIGNNMSKTFCSAHWSEIHLMQDGTFKGCCVMQGPEKGIFKTNSKPNNVVNGLRSAENSDTIKELRLASLNDQWHPNCVRCKNEEAAGLTSHRELYNEKLKDVVTYETAKEYTDPETGETLKNFPIGFYDLNLGNLCNLKCRICHPKASSNWYGDWVKLFNMKGDTFSYPTPQGTYTVKHVKGKKYQIDPDPFAWVDSNDFWKELLDSTPDIKHMFVQGGEPLMIEQHYDYLKRCIELGYSSNMCLEYNTNFTKINPKWVEVWKHFKNVYIGFSLDGMGKEFEYQRHPAKWSQMVKNLQMLDDYITKYPGVFTTRDSPTVNIYNVLHILDYHEWKIKTGREQYKNLFKRHNKTLGTHGLHSPNYLSIKILSPEAKQIVIQKYNQWADKMFAWIDSLPDDYSHRQTNQDLKNNIQHYVNSYIKFIQQDDLSKYQGAFWRFTNKIDEIRNENFKETFPDVYKLLTEYK